MSLNGQPLSTRLKRWRRKRGLSQSEMSRTGGIPQATISMIEAGHRIPTIATLRKFCKVLDLSLTDVLDLD